MTQEEFLDLLHRFAERPMPAVTGRHVYVWHGESTAVLKVLPSSAAQTLELHALAASLSQTPDSTDAARRLLLRAIRARLADVVANRQQVVVVTGCDLLSRYRVPVNPFFEVSSERTAVVLAVPPAETRCQPPEPLPDYVSFNPRAPLEYLRATLGEGSVINTGEE